VWRPCPVSVRRTGAVMFGERLVFRHETLDIHGPGWTQFAAMLGMAGYPAEFARWRSGAPLQGPEFETMEAVTKRSTAPLTSATGSP